MPNIELIGRVHIVGEPQYGAGLWFSMKVAIEVTDLHLPVFTEKVDHSKVVPPRGGAVDRVNERSLARRQVVEKSRPCKSCFHVF